MSWNLLEPIKPLDQSGNDRNNYVKREILRWINAHHPEVVERIKQKAVKEFPYKPRKTAKEKRERRNQYMREKRHRDGLKRQA